MLNALKAPFLSGYSTPFTSWLNWMPKTKNNGCVLAGGTAVVKLMGSVSTLLMGKLPVSAASVLNVFASKSISPAAAKSL